jgi:L-iditol 2-dehydrogenase
MKAALVTERGKIVVQEVPTPQAKETEILIRVESCAICGSDLRITYETDFRVRYPIIIGHEIAGVVVEVGSKVKGLKVGDRVTIAPGVSCGTCDMCKAGLQNLCKNQINVGYNYPGGMAEFMVIPRQAISGDFVNKIPRNISFDESALAEPLACCINGQNLSEVNRATTLAIIGAGPTGCLHVELARSRKVARILLAQRSLKRLQMAAKLGVDALINASLENSVERVLQETKGKGADVVIVACASPEAQQRALEMVALRGKINLFGGLPHGNSVVNIDTNLIHYKECSLQGSNGSTGSQNAEALDLISKGKVSVKHLITHVFPLSEIKEALNVVRTHEGLKVIVKPCEG